MIKPSREKLSIEIGFIQLDYRLHLLNLILD